MLPTVMYSQKRPKAEPVYYLDSVRLKANKIFDPAKIETITQVFDNDTSAPGGKIFIKSKSLTEYQFFTAKQLADKYHITADSPAIFMLDERVIRDTSQFEIDSSYIAKIEITTNVNYAMPSGKKLLDLRFLKILSWGYLAELESKKKKKRSRN